MFNAGLATSLLVEVLHFLTFSILRATHLSRPHLLDDIGPEFLVFLRHLQHEITTDTRLTCSSTLSTGWNAAPHAAAVHVLTGIAERDCHVPRSLAEMVSTAMPFR